MRSHRTGGAHGARVQCQTRAADTSCVRAIDIATRRDALRRPRRHESATPATPPRPATPRNAHQPAAGRGGRASTPSHLTRTAARFKPIVYAECLVPMCHALRGADIARVRSFASVDRLHEDVLRGADSIRAQRRRARPLSVGAQSDEDGLAAVQCFVLNVPSCLQEGPMCGLTALAMCVAFCSLVATAERTELEDCISERLIERAIERGFTRRGEMFEAERLVQLCADEASGAGLLAGRMLAPLSAADVIGAVLDGDLVLFPYDADRNNEPALRHGHGAHWCVVIGLVLPAPPGISAPLLRLVCGGALGTGFGMHAHVAAGDEVLFTELSTDGSERAGRRVALADVCVVVRHGKTRHAAVWGLAALLASNANLAEAHPLKHESGLYATPEDGALHGLRGQAVRVSNAPGACAGRLPGEARLAGPP